MVDGETQPLGGCPSRRLSRGLKNSGGIVLSLPVKREVMNYLKQLMEDGRVHSVEFIDS